MRISDWSSDVCSSDLTVAALVELALRRLLRPDEGDVAAAGGDKMFGGELAADVILAPHPVEGAARAAPADEVEAGGLRLREIVPRRAVAGRADDDHRVGEAEIGRAHV